ncbi:hypothetical protein AJ85_13690 [Alkalihalobacillus alcalophilus ATCC 27647 = CGMCC 1.3604]|uniref:PDZ domain-containing protein n=1 Tax=Alkalihalobacillus alcalophilus ATCC 27647 = CGMCC 1.3604 TaxID=1218173 RepID=A0A094WM40_ALKAL|nr:PDZ domain-containing protein [Alkalihalobacillus alcalophilus]KGA97033.1 hypothetical protein BALCAV_0212785 [Alkalihalobacillus alcalophilus ATCC 27647 = CGMCC 1.3604]MED1563410.1 PDZ domain-containing protein [Alkalihalobacillus alcalophilus]THG90044.1 hypothetical protein AJ85_13690 [Alkalihalobacillus alcalophilus ATCC 27647 = CGMCC 1.3604]
MSEKNSFFKKRYIILIVLFCALYFYQLPYYYSEPGSAEILSQYIELEGAEEATANEDVGTFMLTTIQMGRANTFLYLWSYLSPYRVLHPDETIRYEGESDREYHHRQIMLMNNSQQAATIIAYEKAGKDVQYDYQGAIITQLIEEMPAEEKLEIGDRIIEIDGQTVRHVEDLFSLLEGKGEEDIVTFTLIRNDVEETYEVGFSKFPEQYLQEGEEERVGIGIANPVTAREVTFDPDIKMDTEQIGGPSAGLMFSLEIMNQLSEEDLTKGYHIAGTGSISESGTVGRIGGAAQKLVAAEKAGADYFFAPSEEGRTDSNYAQALEAAEDIDANVVVVPIDTIDDALEFLEQLEGK